MPKQRRSRKSLEGFRRRFRGDLRHALRCCEDGRLPRRGAAYLRAALKAVKLPPPLEVSERIKLTFEQRESNKLFTIPPIDKSKEELTAIKRQKERERKVRARRKAGVAARKSRNEPWLAEGVSRTVWYRQRAKSGTRVSGPPEGQVGRECPDHGTPVSRGYINIPRTQQSHVPSPTKRSRRLASKEEPAPSSLHSLPTLYIDDDDFPDIDFHGSALA
jgi:hypothetical protein